MMTYTPQFSQPWQAMGAGGTTKATVVVGVGGAAVNAEAV